MDNQLENYSRILFVSGSGRSGTNVTKEILSHHHDVASLPFEYRFTIDPRGVVDFLNSYPNGWSPFWPDEKINDFISFLSSLSNQSNEKSRKIYNAYKKNSKGLELTPPTYPGWELEKWIPRYQSFVDELEKELTVFRYRAVWPGSPVGKIKNKMIFAPHWSKQDLLPKLQRFLDKINRSIIEHQQRKVFLEDNTYSILFADDLLDLYPNSKLLHVIRDPRDVVSSFLKQRWCPSDCMQAVQMYKAIIDRWFNIEKKLSKKYFKYVKLEDLVSDPKNTIKSICNFSNIPFEIDITKIDLSKSHKGRWKHDLSRDEKTIVNNELKNTMVRLGYL